MIVINGLDEYVTWLGKEIGVSEWHEVTQPQVNLFADATIDHQWIHTDPERCAKESPFKQPIAHGFLVLSLLPHFLEQVYELRGVRMTINVGLNQVRFVQPVPVGSRLRLRVALAHIERNRNSVQATLACSVEAEGQSKPVCTAESLLYYRA